MQLRRCGGVNFQFDLFKSIKLVRRVFQPVDGFNGVSRQIKEFYLITVLEQLIEEQRVVDEHTR